jgi:hypothetical protein
MVSQGLRAAAVDRPGQNPPAFDERPFLRYMQGATTPITVIAAPRAFREFVLPVA